MWLATTVPLHLAAQNKPAHINKQQLLQAMPGYNEARDSMQAFLNEAQTHYYELLNGYDDSVVELQKSDDEADKTIVNNYVSRIVYWENNIERLTNEKEKELFDPLRNAIENAIGQVAAEHRFTDVRDSSLGTSVLLPNSRDIMHLVKQKLGIAAP